MKNKTILLLFSLLLFTIGCSMNDSSREEPNTYPINNEPNKGRNQIEKFPEIDYSNYEQSQRRMKEFEEKDPQVMGADIYTNEETKRVAEHLKKQNDILNAQVASTDDRIIVAVTLSDYGNQDIGNEIEQDVRTIVKDKEIVVYTDYTYWQQLKDEMASEGPSSIGADVEDFLENFFNVEMKK